MDSVNENDKGIDITNILTPRPQRIYINPQASPFSQSLLNLSPITGRLSSPIPFFPQ